MKSGYIQDLVKFVNPLSTIQVKYNQECIRESMQLRAVVYTAVMFCLNDITIAVPSTSTVQGIGHE